MSGEPVLKDEVRNKIGVEREWHTSEINPREITEALDGVLEKSDDVDSGWNIQLGYGRKRPLLALKINPEERRFFVVVYGPKKKNYLTYRYVSSFYDVESLWFIQYRHSKKGKLQTDIIIKVRSDGKISATCVISSNWYRAFEVKVEK